jgi:hypothetical protein
MTKIDFEHWLGSQIGYTILDNLDLERKLSIISALKPTFTVMGSKWSYMYGDPGSCIVGIGDTAIAAMEDFVKNFYNQKVVITQQKY